MVHNLRMVDFAHINTPDYGFDWAIEAREVFNKHLLDQNFQALIDYQKLGKSVQLAIPTPDHYFPLIYNLGMSTEKDEIRLFNDQMVGGSLNMTSVQFG
jgi:4,5-DOPA dioxygenase extradiol